MSRRIDYDTVAADYGSRYERNDYPGVRQALAAFVTQKAGEDPHRVLEVGCGTGHWLQFLHEAGISAVGLDPSRGMLDVARERRGVGRLIRAQAEAVPVQNGTCDRILCVNALHHFTDPAAFFREARRVLRARGGLLTVGLDPHTGQDRWWIYDYFPTAFDEDRRRYLPAGTIRDLMAASGFLHCETREVQHVPVRMTVSEAARRGFLDRTSTSQLMVISEAEYDAGIKRIHSANADAGGEMILRADLRLYGTIGCV